MTKCEIITSTLQFWSYEFLFTISVRSTITTESMIQREDEAAAPTALIIAENEGVPRDSSQIAHEVRDAEQNSLNVLLSEVYRYLMIFAACMVCLAHGSNDVANSISPLLVVLNDEGYIDSWAYYLGGAGISLGLLILGYKVMETVGKDVIKLDFQKGYCC